MRKTSDLQDAADHVLTRAAQRGLLQRAAEDESLTGRSITLAGRTLTQFGSCSYLGLETDERLQAGAIDAIRRYGTQFSSSRAYVSAPPYEELETLLGQVFGTPTLVTPSSTLAHMSAMPVLVGDDDVILLDQQVHTTVQMAVNHVRAHGVPVEIIRHNRLDRLSERITALSRKHRRVWYMADGIYSMYGDQAPLAELTELLGRHEQLHLYVDDAHGMGWTGRHGRGFALEGLSAHPRVVVATSFAKSFATGGGALVVADAELRRRIRTIGSAFVFSGPLQPATLGAAIASARLHLSDELPGLQDALLARIEHCNRLCREHGLPLVSEEPVPIRFIGTGLSSVSFQVVERLMDEGFYCNIAVFPAVPMQRAGIRFTLTLHQSFDDITRFIEAVARHLPAALEAEGSSLAEVRRTFKLAEPAAPPAAPRLALVTATELVASTGHPGLVLEHQTSIDALDDAEWDRLLGAHGAFSADGLRMLEGLHTGRSAAEDDWKFHYYVVRDESGEPVLATFFTEALWKDDMLASEAVSRQLEEIRRQDPYHMTSRYFAMGALTTEGRHLYLDRSRDWQGGMGLLLGAVRLDQASAGATHLVLRDMMADDVDLDAYLTDQGFARLPMPDAMVLALDWADEAAYLAGRSPRTRTFLERHVLPYDTAFEQVVFAHGGLQPSEAELAECYALYREVKARAFALNTFDLPADFFAHILASPAWEVLALRREPGGPLVGLAACFKGPEQYVPLLVGMDYDLVTSHALYRQLNMRMVRRAHALGAKRIHMGFGAEIEKSRFGARPQRQVMYLQSADLFHFEQIDQLTMAGRSHGASR